MSADILTLGGIVFRDFSAPERMPFGGRHTLKVHKLIGGQRVIDAMGPDDREIAWSGTFWGDNALAQAQELDALRALGQPLGLSLGRLPMCVPYSISCVVAQNGALGALGAIAQGVDSLVSGDLAFVAAGLERASIRGAAAANAAGTVLPLDWTHE